ncbi:MAG TPA: hypothetical protein VLG38_00055 [Gammaproteobacteria bacterium]|nr:hypothetical protein [Gammaproteobacteria bacterium]
MPTTLQNQTDKPARLLRALIRLLFLGYAIYLVKKLKDDFPGMRWQSAIDSGNVARVQELLDRGYDINATFSAECFVGGSGWIGGALPSSRIEKHTPLSYAMYIRSMRSFDDGVVEFLLQAGAKPVATKAAQTSQVNFDQDEMPALEPIPSFELMPANRAIINRTIPRIQLIDDENVNPNVQTPTNQDEISHICSFTSTPGG